MVTIEGRKVSGNAQYRMPSRLLHHGTILFGEALEVVPTVVPVRQDKIESNGIKSVRSRVTTIRPDLPLDVGLHDVRAILTEPIGRHNGELRIDDAIRVQVTMLVKERVGQWEWNFGQSPPFHQKPSAEAPSFRAGRKRGDARNDCVIELFVLYSFYEPDVIDQTPTTF